MEPGITLNPEATGTLRLAEHPDVLSLEQVARSCGRSHAWAREKAGGGELPLLPGHGERRVGKLALLGWLAGEQAEAFYRALLSPASLSSPRAEEPHV